MRTHTHPMPTDARPRPWIARGRRRLERWKTSRWGVGSLLLCLTAGVAGSAAADDDIIVISAQKTVVEIPFARLLANDGAALGLATQAPTARGTLTSHGVAFHYSPNPSFLQSGIDSFRYTPLNGTGAIHTVYLVAGLDRLGMATGAATPRGGACELGPGWAFTNGGVGASMDLNFQNDCVINIDNHPGVDTLLQAPEGSHTGPSPGGGHTDISIDIGGLPPPFDASSATSNLLVFATAQSDPDSNVVFALRHETDGSLTAIARQTDGSYAETGNFPIAAGLRQVGFTWWFERDDEMRDGGMLVTVDGVQQAIELGIANFAHRNDFRFWHVGPYDHTGFGRMVISDPSVWSSEIPARFPPQFSDNGFMPMAWSHIYDSHHVQSVDAPEDGDPEWYLDINGRAGGGLVDATVVGQSQYAARFEIGLEKLLIPTGAKLTVFRGVQQPSGLSSVGRGDAFRVEIQRALNGRIQLRAVAAEGAMTHATPWLWAVGFAQRQAIEVRWRAASSPTAQDGAISLRVRYNAVSAHGLDNANVRLGTVLLGPAHVENASGSLIFDAFDAWH